MSTKLLYHLTSQLGLYTKAATMQIKQRTQLNVKACLFSSYAIRTHTVNSLSHSKWKQQCLQSYCLPFFVSVTLSVILLS